MNTLTASQVERLVAWYDRIIVVADGDVAGREMDARVRRLVADRKPCGGVKLPEGRDPADLSGNELQALLGHPNGLDRPFVMV